MDKDSITAQSLRRGTIIGILSVILGKSFPDKYMLILSIIGIVILIGLLIDCMRRKNYQALFMILSAILLLVCVVILQCIEKYNILNYRCKEYMGYITIFSIFSILVSGGIYHYKQGGPGRAYVKNSCKILGILFIIILICLILIHLGY